MSAVPELPSGAENKLDKALREKLKAFSLGLKVTGGVAIELAIDCTDSASADLIRQEFANGIAEGHKAFETVKGQLPPLLAQLGDGFTKTLAAAGQGTTVRLTSSLPEIPQQQLTDLSGQVMGAVFSAMLGGGSGQAPGVSAAEPVMESGSGEPQESEVTQGVLEGVRVIGQAGWTQEPGLDDKGDPLPAPLEVAVDIAGGEAARAAQYGMYQIDKITTADGKSLTLQKPRLWEGPTKTYLRRAAEDSQAGSPDPALPFDRRSPLQTATFRSL